MAKIIKCEECGIGFNEPIHRDCYDICDACFDKMQDRLKWVNENRMDLAQAAVGWANMVGTKEAKLAAFFACVMPEYPALKVKKFIQAACENKK